MYWYSYDILERNKESNCKKPVDHLGMDGGCIRIGETRNGMGLIGKASVRRVFN